MIKRPIFHINLSVACWTALFLSLAPFQCPGQPIYSPYSFNTFAGVSGHPGTNDGTLVNGHFNRPGGVAFDTAGILYVADTFNSTIRTVNAVGVANTIAGLAGSFGGSDGNSASARFNYPSSLAVDAFKNIYVADTLNSTIRKISFAAVVSTLAGTAGRPGSADGSGSGARFSFPGGVALDGARNVFVADTYNCTIRKITPAGVVTTVAGRPGQAGSADGIGTSAQFNNPTGLIVDVAGNIFVADVYNHTIRKVTSTGVVTTLAGLAGTPGAEDGTGKFARFNDPCAVALDPSGNLWVADKNSGVVRRVTQSGVVTTTAVGLFEPNGIACSSSGILCVADTGYHVIRTVIGSTIVTLVGELNVSGVEDGGIGAHFNSPYGLVADGTGNLFVADTYNCSLRKVSWNGMVTTIAGLSGTPGSANGMGNSARFNYPSSLALDAGGGLLVADTGNHAIRRVTSNGMVTTLAGTVGVSGSSDGIGSAASFHSPSGVAIDRSGNSYIADYGNQTIRKVTSAGVVTTLAGQIGVSGNADGLGILASFNYPTGVAIDAVGNILVADFGNSSIRKITPLGLVTTFAGGTVGNADGLGIGARFTQPFGVVVDNFGNSFVADTINCTIREISSQGLSKTLAGMPRISGSVDGIGSSARFNYPYGVAVDPVGTLYIADSANHLIRVGHATNDSIVILVPGPGLGFSGGHFTFSLTGPPGLPFVVEKTSNLISWLPVGTNTFINGNTVFTDSASSNSGRRYYRARLQ